MAYTERIEVYLKQFYIAQMKSWRRLFHHLPHAGFLICLSKPVNAAMVSDENSCAIALPHGYECLIALKKFEWSNLYTVFRRPSTNGSA